MSNIAVIYDHGETAKKSDGRLHGRQPVVQLPKVGKERLPPAVIIERSLIFRAGLSAILAKNGYRIAAACSDYVDLDTRQLPKGLKGSCPALVLIGLEEVDGDPLSNARNLIDQGFRVVILAQKFRPDALISALRIGVYGYLLKDQIEPVLLSNALALVRLGSVVIPSGMACLELDVPVSRSLGYEAPGSGVSPLSKGDLTILELLTQGASNKIIARKLDIAEATVKVRIMFILRKLHVSNRTQAAMWAMQHLPRVAEAGRDR